MRMRIGLAALVAGAALSLSALGAESHPTGEAKHAPGPVISQQSEWAGPIVGAMLALFATAMFIGPIYRMNMPEEPQTEDFHSHDEPPGTSHHHGASGTIDHSAPDKPAHH